MCQQLWMDVCGVLASWWTVLATKLSRRTFVRILPRACDQWSSRLQTRAYISWQPIRSPWTPYHRRFTFAVQNSVSLKVWWAWGSPEVAGCNWCQKGVDLIDYKDVAGPLAASGGHLPAGRGGVESPRRRWVWRRRQSLLIARRSLVAARSRSWG